MSGRRQKPDELTGDLFAAADAAEAANVADTAKVASAADAANAANAADAVSPADTANAAHAAKAVAAHADAARAANADSSREASSRVTVSGTKSASASPLTLSNAPIVPARIDTSSQMLDVLDRWVERGWLRSLDAGFARFIALEVPQAAPLLLLAAALASHQLGRGHVCLDLQATIDDPTFVLSLPPEEPVARAAREAGEPRTLPPTPSEVLTGVTLVQWRAALDAPAIVARDAGRTRGAAEAANASSTADAFGTFGPNDRMDPVAASNAPLVLIDGRLYLRRYWQYEQDVRAGIAQRLTASTRLQSALPVDVVRQALDVLFPASPDAAAQGLHTDWQKLACALAARSGFSIVTGGPGTGKTTTVVKLLALLQALALHAPGDAPAATASDVAGGSSAPKPRPLRIRLAAPTGKAAARLNESIAGAVARLPVDALPDGEAVRAAIPTVVATLHRVLGTLPDSRRFRHHAGNPLPVDVLVIDEASMVDLEMMAAVLSALPPSARLILLGDKDQLASVEAGAVIGELCARAAGGHYTPATAAWLEAVTGERIDVAMIDADGTALDQAIVMLRHSHRFASDSGIGLLASLVNAGEAGKAERIWDDAHPDLALVRCSATDDAAFRSLVIDGYRDVGDVGAAHAASKDTLHRQGYRHYLDVMHARKPTDADGDIDRWALDVLDAHDAFQLLCALRRGPWGVEGLNRRVARLLQEAGLIDVRGDWYAGRPVLVTRNDYELGLMNGDIGITLALPDGALRVAFPAADGSGGVKWVLPSRLQAVETVFALTVHKSQGSEFTHAALVLPEGFSPVLTRELVYTGITRARSFLSLAVVEGSDVLRLAVGAKVRRASGLGVA